MNPKPLFQAVICVECQHASLIPLEPGIAKSCASCGAASIAIAGAGYIAADVPLFVELESIVRNARLSLFETTSIALELESVSLRWEPPELVLERISTRLPGLRELWDAQQDYPQLVLTVSMLLTVVFARMNVATQPHRRSHQASGVYRVARDSEYLSERRYKNG